MPITNETNIIGIIAATVSFVAIIVTLITAVTSTRQSAFTSLQTVVAQMEKTLRDNQATIEELDKGLKRERKLRMQYEDYIHALIGQLRSANVIPVDMALFVENEKNEPIL